MDALLNAANYVIAPLVLLTVVVFFHELGHFWVARRCGVQVEVFSIGFGTELFGFTDRHGTRWKVSAIPLGGYVKMKGQSDTEGVDTPDPASLSEEERQRSFLFKKLWQKAAIVFAGPAANYVLAIVVFAAIFATYGRSSTAPIIGYVEPGSVAEQAGLKLGDRVVKLAGYDIDEFTRIFYILQVDVGKTVEIVVRRGDETLTLHGEPKIKTHVGSLGNVDTFRDLEVQPHMLPVVGGVTDDTAAGRAGIKAGDRIISIDGTEIEDFAQVSRMIGSGGGKPVDIVIERSGQQQMFHLTPIPSETVDDSGNKVVRPLLGISADPIRETHRYSPFKAVWVASQETVRLTGFILTTIGQMITGNRSASEVGGILRIGKIAGDTAQATLPDFLSLIAMISINLGLINLFPIPLLDGGHLAFYGIEAVRGRPLSPRVQDIALRIGLAAVASLMLFAVWNDLNYLRVIAFFKNLVS
jgi:regulator of sigma E protease